MSQSNLARPLTAQVQVAGAVSSVEFLTALADQCGTRALSCVQPWGSGRYQLTFTSAGALAQAMDSGIRIADVTVPVHALTLRTVWLTVRNAPFEMTPDTLAAALQDFGSVLQHEFQVWPGFPAVSTGTRRVKFRMTKPVPNFLKVGAYTLMFTYEGVLRVCRRCHQPGHVAAGCSAPYCPACGSHAHSRADCPVFPSRRESAPEGLQVGAAAPSQDEAAVNPPTAVSVPPPAYPVEVDIPPLVSLPSSMDPGDASRPTSEIPVLAESSLLVSSPPSAPGLGSPSPPSALPPVPEPGAAHPPSWADLTASALDLDYASVVIGRHRRTSSGSSAGSSDVTLLGSPLANRRVKRLVISDPRAEAAFPGYSLDSMDCPTPGTHGSSTGTHP